MHVGPKRAGDKDREEVVDRLRTALDEGRLDLHEYDERLQQAYAAKTYAELDVLMLDLPTARPAPQSQLYVTSPAARPPEPARQDEAPALPASVTQRRIVLLVSTVVAAVGVGAWILSVLY
ncbi:DUF1707 SHOCT-like domain-containing protein [Actinoplanes sp. CA-051413]|uniref:DUF1707 SHOCT-like domain-containing protein n=1 Tax=Actinoplanes sp. CA-051413 TaxID=3239899 RepID=UPI003D97EF4C